MRVEASCSGANPRFRPNVSRGSSSMHQSIAAAIVQRGSSKVSVAIAKPRAEAAVQGCFPLSLEAGLASCAKNSLENTSQLLVQLAASPVEMAS